MISRLRELFNLHSPRSFAGCVVFCMSLLALCCHGDNIIWYFYGGGGKVNGSDSIQFTTSAPPYWYNTSNLTLTHSDQTMRCVGWYNYDYSEKYCDVGKAIQYHGSAYAKWIQDKYPIFYISNNGKNQTNQQDVVATQSVTLDANTFTRASFKFLGWSTNNTDTVHFADKCENVRPDRFRNYNDSTTCDAEGNPLYPAYLYAVWGKQFTIEFDENGGTGTMDDQVLDDGVPQNLNKCDFEPPLGRKFRYWTSDFGSYRDGDEITYDSESWSGTFAIFTAQWTAIGYTVEFSSNCTEATGSMKSMDFKYDVAQCLRKCGFIRTGYEFIGWAKTPDGEVVYADGADVYNLTTTDGAVITLYAKWAPISYVVKFDAAGGSGTMDNLTCEYDKQYSLPANGFTRVGGAFLGWTTNGTSSVVYNDRASISNLSSVANSTNVLRAVWSNVKYYIAFDANGGSGTVPTLDCEYGSVYNLPSNDFTRVGYVFNGWTTNATTAAVYAEGAAVSNLTLVADSTVDLFATWRPIKYVVTFNANGGSGSMVPQTNTYDVAIALTANAFTMLGRNFGGWATNSTGSAVYSDCAVVSNLVAVENAEYPLYAVWVKDVNNLNDALDNNDLTILQDDSTSDYITVTNDSSFVNGSCVKFESVRNNKCAGDNKGTYGFRIYFEEPGTLTFKWKVVNVFSGWHKSDWDATVWYEEPTGTTNQCIHVTSGDVDDAGFDWETRTISITNGQDSVKFTFFSNQSTYSTSVYALFDYVRWSTGTNPEPTEEDAPTINGAATVEDGKFRVTFAADHRFKYELIKNETLKADDWKSFDPQLFLMPDTDGDISFEPAIETSKDCMFYRVKVLKKD